MDGGLWDHCGNKRQRRPPLQQMILSTYRLPVHDKFYFKLKKTKINKKSFYKARSATHFKFFCSTEGMPGRNSLQSGISAIRGDMELICLIKCLTELAFGVQREFKQKGRDEIRSVEGEGGWHIVAVEENEETKTRRGGGGKGRVGWIRSISPRTEQAFCCWFQSD